MGKTCPESCTPLHAYLIRLNNTLIFWTINIAAFMPLQDKMLYFKETLRVDVGMKGVIEYFQDSGFGAGNNKASKEF